MKKFALETVLKVLLFTFIIILSALPITAETPKPEGSISIAMSDLAEEGFMPCIGFGAQTYLWELVYDFHIYANMVTREPELAVITDFHYSSDYKELTLSIREGIEWDEGWGELTAADIKFTMADSIMREGSTNASSSLFREKIESLAVVDPYTLKIKLNEPDPEFWRQFQVTVNNRFPIICKEYVEKVGFEYAMYHPVGSGPYRLLEHRRGEYLTFEAKDDHWRVVPEFKYVTLRIVPEESTAISMLRSGEVDAIQISPENIPVLERAGFDIRVWPAAYNVFMVFGGLSYPEDERYRDDYHNKDPWVDVRVREAMNIAIDRDAIIKAIYYGGANPLHVTVPATGSEKLELIEYNPQRARELLAEAGYPNGFNVKILSHALSPGAEMHTVFEIISGYWEAVGLNTEIVMSDFSTFRPDAMSISTAGSVWGMRFTTRDSWETLLIYNKPDGPWPIYLSEELTSLLREFDGILDWRERLAFWPRITQYWRENYTTVNVVSPGMVWVTNDKIGEWPENYGKPYNLEWLRHPTPLNTYRLFEIN